jgi:hypothetical protein
MPVSCRRAALMSLAALGAAAYAFSPAWAESHSSNPADVAQASESDGSDSGLPAAQGDQPGQEGEIAIPAPQSMGLPHGTVILVPRGVVSRQVMSDQGVSPSPGAPPPSPPRAGLSPPPRPEAVLRLRWGHKALLVRCGEAPLAGCVRLVAPLIQRLFFAPPDKEPSSAPPPPPATPPAASGGSSGQ